MSASSGQGQRNCEGSQALGVEALAIQADSANVEAVVVAVKRTVRELGGIDILVNSAGIAVIAPIDDYRLEDLDRTLAVNVRAVFVATQAAVKHMQAGGRIINVGSCNAERVPFMGGSVYAMSKAALVGLVNPMETEITPSTTDFAKMLMQVMALHRNGTGNEIAFLVVYLASPETAYAKGASLSIDGGFTT